MYNFENYNRIFKKESEKGQQETIIVKIILNMLNKYNNIEQFINKNGNLQTFLKQNNCQTVISHWIPPLDENDYNQILNSIKKSFNIEQNFQNENIKIQENTPIHQKQFILTPNVNTIYNNN